MHGVCTSLSRCHHLSASQFLCRCRVSCLSRGEGACALWALIRVCASGDGGGLRRGARRRRRVCSTRISPQARGKQLIGPYPNHSFCVCFVSLARSGETQSLTRLPTPRRCGVPEKSLHSAHLTRAHIESTIILVSNDFVSLKPRLNTLAQHTERSGTLCIVRCDDAQLRRVVCCCATADAQRTWRIVAHTFETVPLPCVTPRLRAAHSAWPPPRLRRWRRRGKRSSQRSAAHNA